ncbi:MAG TPA: lysophospholipid acyltransferase family protein [Acidimicrobiales bacterium]|jgi:1-acyl-sn-glycerol-3-phosphate acyltransferase|nr:lysophospholipid acyltransferase family protein [Acidimicrobiales bacterium]
MAYALIKAILTPILRVAFRIRVTGLENIPKSGPVLIASNHQAFCDSLFIPLAVPRRVTYVAKAEYFDSWKTKHFFRAVGQIPMERSGGAASQKSLGEALTVLEAGGCIGIYPEGTRPPDERLHKGRTGVARLALAAKAPVVPTALLGTRAVQPIGARMLRPFKTVEIRFGRPIDLTARYGDRLEAPLTLREATDEVMFEIAQLSGQVYVDRYASRKAQAAEDARLAESAPLATSAAGRS